MSEYKPRPEDIANQHISSASVPNESEKDLTPDQIRERLNDPNFLPTHEQAVKFFKSLTDAIQRDNYFHDKEKPVYEILNEEYLNACSDYLAQRAQEFGASKDKPVTILEIGAGNGRLSHFLRQKIEEKVPGLVKIVATDSGKQGIKDDFDVEELDHKKALEKHKPDIVISSWMPYSVDFTKDIRDFESEADGEIKRVQEYILIGEKDSTGDEWETWGIDYEYKDKIPPYKKDKYEMEELDDLSKFQISRADHPDDGSYFHSGTHSFKRV